MVDNANDSKQHGARLVLRDIRMLVPQRRKHKNRRNNRSKRKDDTGIGGKLNG
jgi:hypothetical protein